MRYRSEKKIEALVRAALPNAAPFRDATYEEVIRRYNKARDAWERYRDSICPATRCIGRTCICAYDPRLKDHPLRTEFILLVNEVNRLDREAYDKLVVCQNNLRSIYHQSNDAKWKFHNNRGIINKKD